VDVIETGYGSPSIGDFLVAFPDIVQEHYDYGYGTPTAFLLGVDPADPANWQDTGYGSPFASVVVQFPLSGLVVPDDGGFVVRLPADWPTVGPYQVSLIGVTGAVFPCHTVYEGAGGPFDCFTDDDAEKLRFATPRLYVGVFDLEISWLEGGLQVLNYPAAVTVERRTRHPSVYTVRAGFPKAPYRAIGPRALNSLRTLGA